MKTKLLVANRAEIACRIFQACREMGFKSVGLKVPGDEDCRHLTYADEIQAVPSYLDGEAIVKAALNSQSKLIHPGYGFLSERPSFARAVEEANLIFIGPKAKTMELMGAKIAAKELAAREKVPTLPWARVERGEDIRAAAKRVGFPLLLKASAGGGGKGMRKVLAMEELGEASESASAEAMAAFGDGTLFLERLLENPRHIEVQVFGDGLGEGVHLYERECSLQRRHQKIWEEATAPNLADKTRQGLLRASLQLVRATQYRNAGTVEFLVDEEENFYFLEMNTRLQVEHPVTELVTGVDLVWAQLKQALEPSQKFLSQVPIPHGNAIEVRLYAEDPAQGYIPTAGRIEKLRWPTGAGIRVESGIEEGQRVGTQFDSMLGKLVVWAPTRAHALQRLRFALEETLILGIGTNQSFLHAMTNHSKIKEGKVSTDFIESEFLPFKEDLSGQELEILAAAQALGLGQQGMLMGDCFQENNGKNRSPWVIDSHE